MKKILISLVIALILTVIEMAFFMNGPILGSKIKDVGHQEKDKSVYTYIGREQFNNDTIKSKYMNERNETIFITRLKDNKQTTYILVLPNKTRVTILSKSMIEVDNKRIPLGLYHSNDSNEYGDLVYVIVTGLYTNSLWISLIVIIMNYLGILLLITGEEHIAKRWRIPESKVNDRFIIYIIYKLIGLILIGAIFINLL